MITCKEFEVMRTLRKRDVISMDDLVKEAMVRSYEVPYAAEEIPPVYERLVDCGYVKNFKVTKMGYAELRPYKVDNALILAAGGTEVSAKGVYSLPKGLYQIDGEVLIERQIRQLKEAGIVKVYVVLGYKKHTYFYLEEKCDVDFIINPQCKKNNIYSLHAHGKIIY